MPVTCETRRDAQKVVGGRRGHKTNAWLQGHYRVATRVRSLSAVEESGLRPGGEGGTQLKEENATCRR